jgi:hypothetical protein
MSRLIVQAESADGHIYGQNADYESARATSSGCSTSSTTLWVGQFYDGAYHIYRGCLSFDTSALPADALIVHARLFLCGAVDWAAVDHNQLIYRYTWQEALCSYQEANYDGAYGGSATLEGTLCNTVNFVVDGWQSIEVDTHGINRSGDSKYTVVSEEDVNDSQPGADEIVQWYSANASDPTKRPYLEITYTVQKTYAACHAPGVPPLLYVKDRSQNLVADPWALTEKKSGLVYSSAVGTGYETCSFQIPCSLQRQLSIKHAYNLAVKCGISTVWEGRVADIERHRGDIVTITALGGAAHLRQRRATYAASSGQHAHDVLMDLIAAYCPLISTNFIDFRDPNFNVGGMSWTREDIQAIAKELMDAGDNQTPPRLWYLNIWHTESLTPPGSFNGSVGASADDADNDGYTGTVVRIGFGSSTRYVAGLIFRGLDIPRGATVLSAYAEVYSEGELGGDGDSKVNIHCERDGTPDDFSVSLPSARTKTYAHTYWQEDWKDTQGTWISTPQFVSAVQEVVNLESVSDLCVIFDSIETPGYDTRKQFQAWDHAETYQAKLHVIWGQSEETTMAFHGEFIPRTAANLENADYVVRQEDIAGSLDLIQTDKELVNKVVASYGSGPSYTAAAEDADSQALYDVRENDPAELFAGESASQTQAENIRDAELADKKDIKWMANDFTVHRLRNRGGNFVNLAAARAGCIVHLADFPTFERDTSRSFFIVRCEYNDDERVLTLSPEIQPSTLAIILKRIKGD